MDTSRKAINDRQANRAAHSTDLIICLTFGHQPRTQMNRTVWTPDMRKILYVSLLAEFGPHNKWKGARYPTDKRQQFNGAMRRLAVIFSALANKNITPEAVEQQVDWAITVQKEIRNQGHARQFILNKAAALEVGFIETGDLPGFISVGKHVSRSAVQKILDQL